jgi:hypothetical protein
MIKHAALAASAAALIAAVAAAYAQTTVLGPNMTTATVSGAGSMATLAANPTRKALTICNEHASNTMTFTLGTLSPVSLTTGRVLAAGNLVTSCITIGSPSSVGSSGVGAQVNTIASGASTPVTFIEYY